MSGQRGTDYAALATTELRADQQRNLYFAHSRIFGDPAWELMLEAYVATAANRCVDLSDLKGSICRPASVIARLAAILEAEGYLERCPSREMQKVDCVKLTKEAMSWCEQCLDFKRARYRQSPD